MLKLLGKSPSINVRKLLWLCAELALEVEHEQWGAGFRSTQTPEFLALNPNGMVPVLIDGELVLWESNTICRYLAARQGRADLTPMRRPALPAVQAWFERLAPRRGFAAHVGNGTP